MTSRLRGLALRGLLLASAGCTARTRTVREADGVSSVAAFWGSSATDAWAVGSHQDFGSTGLVLHWDGAGEPEAVYVAGSGPVTALGATAQRTSGSLAWRTPRRTRT